MADEARRPSWLDDANRYLTIWDERYKKANAERDAARAESDAARAERDAARA